MEDQYRLNEGRGRNSFKHANLWSFLRSTRTKLIKPTRQNDHLSNLLGHRIKNRSERSTLIEPLIRESYHDENMEKDNHVFFFFFSSMSA